MALVKAPIPLILAIMRKTLLIRYEKNVSGECFNQTYLIIRNTQRSGSVSNSSMRQSNGISVKLYRVLT